MIMLLIAGLLVVLPGIVVILFFVFSEPTWVVPALVSVGINILPFIVAILLLRAQKRRAPGEAADMGH
ncbi:MAG TPA: hypothetical protein VGR27_15785 [Longimicrobiaceae bacterium]|nr:hypothetical protein [Longimicrobiaceae bacterium]